MTKILDMSFIRRNFITGEPVQIKYLALLFFSMLIPLLFVGGCLYFLIFNIMAEQIGIPEYIAYNLYPVIKKINMILLLGFPPLFLLLLLWGVLVSHRFTGPLRRLKDEIEYISKSGDYTKRLRVRKHDDLKLLVEAINKLVSRIREDKSR